MPLPSPNHGQGRNFFRAAFTDDSMRELYDDVDKLTEDLVADLRLLIGPKIDDPELAALINEMSNSSPRFRELWARHDVKSDTGGTRLLRHADVGDIEVYRERFAIDGTNGLHFVIFHAEPGSASERAIAELAARLG